MEVATPDLASCKSLVAELLRSPDTLPVLPTLTQEIRDALARSDISIPSLSKLIERDPTLSDVLLRYASSVMLRSHMPPQTVFDVVRVLGMRQVERITIVHATRVLFSTQGQAYTRLFTESWDRLVQKASTSSLIAKQVGRVLPEYALLGSILSEVGTLTVLWAFKHAKVPVPAHDDYVSLCREYAKNLGVALLTKWEMEEDYIKLIRQVGNWFAGEDEPFGLVDVVNLGLYHSLKAQMTPRRLPPLTNLSAYHKLSDKHNAITDTNELELVVMHRDDIRTIADSLY